MAKAATKGPRPKHVPQRTCVACRTTGAKRGLVRIVRTPAGNVEVDETGKKSGRGAYLCRSRDCWEKALKGKVLEYALKTAITAEDKANLQAYAASLPEDSVEDTERTDQEPANKAQGSGTGEAASSQPLTLVAEKEE